MNELDQMHIDALLWLERTGFASPTDRAQLENYRRVYPDYCQAKERVQQC